jgi:hypothetical protein
MGATLAQFYCGFELRFLMFSNFSPSVFQIQILNSIPAFCGEHLEGKRKSPSFAAPHPVAEGARNE